MFRSSVCLRWGRSPVAQPRDGVVTALLMVALDGELDDVVVR